MRDRAEEAPPETIRERASGSSRRSRREASSRRAVGSRVETAAKRRHGDDARSAEPHSVCEPPVGGDDAKRRRIGVVHHDPHDLVIGGVPASEGGEPHGHAAASAGANVLRSSIEDDVHPLPGRRGVALEFRDQPTNGAVGIPPPSIRPRSDDVHSVDEPARTVPGIQNGRTRRSSPEPRTAVPIARISRRNTASAVSPRTSFDG